MDQNYEAKFVILTQDILEDNRINFVEKIILARITGFKIFYESSAKTAEALNTSELVVQRAKRKLEKLGYIEVVEDTGRGKKYQANLWKSHIRCDKKVTSDLTKKSHQMLQKSQTYNKKRINNNNEQESKKGYGRADINELEDLWESETGISIKGQQNQRRQLYNLLRKYGSDAIKTLVKRVGVATRSRDKFAPQIALPSDLTGKYSKLAKLQMWENRNKYARPFGSPAPMPVPKGIPDYNGAWDEQSDEERAKVSEMMRKTRERMKF